MNRFNKNLLRRRISIFLLLTLYVGLCFEAAAFPEDLTAELSTTLVACGDDFRVSGVSRNADSVNILVIPPRGSDGTQIETGSVNSDKPSENIYHKTASVSKIDREFEKRITVDKDADTGKYLVVVLSPGKDGRYGATDADPSGIFSKLVKDYGLDVTAMTQEKLVAIIQDATVDAVGSDDLIWLGYVKVESAYVDLNPVEAVKIGEPLNVSGTTNRESGTMIKISIFAGHTNFMPAVITKVEWPTADGGVFTTAIDTSAAVAGTYTLEVDDGEGNIDTADVEILPLPSSFGSISVSSDPSGADIYLDGKYQGTTPKTISDVISGDHKIELKKSGYEDWSAPVSVKADETDSVSAGLRPETEIQETGYISITSEPPGAEIYLDGKYQGTTPMTLSDVISGDHKIKLKKSGYEDWSYSVSVKADETEYVSAELISPPLDSFYPIIFFVCTVAIVLIFIIYRRKKAPSGKTTLTKLPKSENEYRAKMEEWEKEGYDVSELKEVLEGKK